MNYFNFLSKSVVVLSLLLLLNACSKKTENFYDPKVASGNTGYTGSTGYTGYTSTGTLMFWEYEYGNVCSVSINGYSGSITSYYPSNSQYNAPSCSSSGCFSIDLPYGSYYYSATDGSHSWTGTANVTGSCNTIMLYW